MYIVMVLTLSEKYISHKQNIHLKYPEIQGNKDQFTNVLLIDSIDDSKQVTSKQVATEIIDGITYSLNNTTYNASVINNGATYSYAIYIPTSVTSNSGQIYSVTSIESSAFLNSSNLSSIIIPDSVTSIGSYAFSNCLSLMNITIPNSVTSIGDLAFLNSSNLSSVYFDSTGILPTASNLFDDQPVTNNPIVISRTFIVPTAYYNSGVTTPSGSNNASNIQNYLIQTLGFSYAYQRNRTPQTITGLSPTFVISYGYPSFNLDASASSGLELSYASSNTGVVTVSNIGEVTIITPGTTTIIVTQQGNESYKPVGTSVTVTAETAAETAQDAQDAAETAETALAQAIITTELWKQVSTLYFIASQAWFTASDVESEEIIVEVYTALAQAALAASQATTEITDLDSTITLLYDGSINLYKNTNVTAYRIINDVKYTYALPSNDISLSAISSDETVATVDSITGIVSAVGVGSVTITVFQAGNAYYLDASASTILTVGKAQQSINVDSSFNVVYGESSFNLGASASSGLPLSYSIDASNIATVSSTGQVTIKSVGETKINIVQAGNAYYLDTSASTILKVEATVPSAPTITGVIVDANDNDASNNTYSKVDVSFNIPSSNGGSNITNYQYSINDASFVTLTPIQVSNPLIITYTFMADSSYNIKIRAVNEAGEGASSPISNFNFSVPSAPIITKITAKDSKATIQFTVSDNNSSLTTSYELSRDGGLTYDTVNATITGTTGTIELTDLTDLTTYSFMLRRLNGVGSGDPSETSLVSNVCFLAGTLIQTNQGAIAIEKIDPKIHTIRNKKICHITRTITQDKYLVCIEKNALGNNIPSEKTIISKNHCIWYNGKMVAAKELVNKFENVKKVKYQGDVLYNVLMEEADKMLVNNLICETLDPANIIAKVYNLTSDNTKEEKRYIINKLKESIKS